MYPFNIHRPQKQNHEIDRSKHHKAAKPHEITRPYTLTSPNTVMIMSDDADPTLITVKSHISLHSQTLSTTNTCLAEGGHPSGEDAGIEQRSDEVERDFSGSHEAEGDLHPVGVGLPEEEVGVDCK